MKLKPFLFTSECTRPDTTAIQKYLTLNRDVLARNGVLYPRQGFGPISHRPLALSMFPRTDLAAKAGKFRRKIRKAARFDSTSDGDTVLLSSEAFSRFNSAQIQKLMRWLKPGSVKIIVFFRRQDHWFESLYNQNIKKVGQFSAQTIDSFKQKKMFLQDWTITNSCARGPKRSERNVLK